VPARIRFSDEDLRSFYDKHRERLFVTPPRVRVKAIIAPTAKLAEDARRKAANGEDIDELIAEYFVPYFAEHRRQEYLDKQVDFEWVDQNEFWRGDKRTGPLWGLKVGGLSKPHPCPSVGSTYAVLKIVAKRDAATASLKEVRDNVYSHLWGELADTGMLREIRLGKSPLCGMCRAKRNANGQLWHRAQHYIERGDSRKAVSACLLALREDRLDPRYGGPKANEKGLYPEEQYLVDHGMDLARYYVGAMDRAQRGQRVHLPDWISSRAALIKDDKIVPALIRLVANRGRWCKSAAHALATIKADSAIPVLKDMLSDRHLCIVELYWGGKEAVFAQYYLRARARYELRRMGIDPGGVKVTVGTVEGDRLPDDWVNTDTTATPFPDAVSSEPDPQIGRLLSIRAARWSDSEGGEAQPGSEKHEAIEQAIEHMLSGHGHKVVMQPRIDAVASFGEDAVPLLVKRYETASDESSSLLVSSLCQIASPNALSFVRQILTDHAKPQSTANAIREYPIDHEDDIVGLLIELVRVQGQRYDASERLKDMIQRKPSRAGELVQALEDQADSEGFSHQLGEILAFVSGYSHTWCVSIPPGENAVVFRNEFWRNWWSRNRSEDVFGWLVETVTSDNDSRKAQALQRMGTAGDRRAIPFFIKGLDSQSERVQYWAVVGLKGIERSLPATGYAYESFEREKSEVISRLKQKLE